MGSALWFMGLFIEELPFFFFFFLLLLNVCILWNEWDSRENENENFVMVWFGDESICSDDLMGIFFRWASSSLKQLSEEAGNSPILLNYMFFKMIYCF